jgi:hypothetical protein
MIQLNKIMELTKSKINLDLYGYYFFAVMAFIFIVFAVVGFGQGYQFVYTRQINLHWFVHVHGALLTAWFLIFFTQSILAIKGNFKLHRKLGQFSVVLGVLVFISMGIVTFRTLIGYPMHKDISWANVMFLSLTMSLFGLFFTWGIVLRKNGAAHKRLLFLATLVLISAGFNRVLLFAGVNATLQWLPFKNVSLLGLPCPTALFLYNDLLLIPLLIYDFVTIRHIHKTTLIAGGCIIGVHIALGFVWRFLT